MRYFLVDTENISQYDFIQDYDLTNDDTLVMFISENSNNIRMKDLINITKRGIQIEDEEVCIGTENALDFQLIAKLSILICTLNADTSFFVVSNDTGFDAAIQYLKEKTSANIELIKIQQGNEIAIDIESLNIDIIDKTTKDVINNSGTLSELHNNLRALHGNEKGRELYLKVKKKFRK
jgi:hypothetical protein